MNNKALLGLSLIALSVSAGQAAMAAEEKAEGFIEGSSPPGVRLVVASVDLSKR